jgi:hypothetical protein
MNYMLVVLGVIVLVVSAVLLQQLIGFTMIKEGFRDLPVETEERLSPEVFSYNLLQAVKGPIKRLSSQLLDMNAWKERIDLARLTPVELARRNMTG